MNYWYYSRSNEIFLDLDNKRAISRCFNVISRSLKDGKLPIRDVFIYPSRTAGHVHVVIVLREVMTIIDRIAWSLWMANDRLRVAYILKRCIDEVPHEDLLVTTQVYHRQSDDHCVCLGKHKDALVTGHCEAMARLIGRDAALADYFTRTGQIGLRPVDPILFPWGRVSIKQLKQWGNSECKTRKKLSTT